MESFIGPILTLVLAATGYTVNSLSKLDRRIDEVTLDLAKNYVTRAELDERFSTLFNHLHRIEEKLDAHVSEDNVLIQKMKSKYFQ